MNKYEKYNEQILLDEETKGRVFDNVNKKLNNQTNLSSLYKLATACCVVLALFIVVYQNNQVKDNLPAVMGIVDTKNDGKDMMINNDDYLFELISLDSNELLKTSNDEFSYICLLNNEVEQFDGNENQQQYQQLDNYKYPCYIRLDDGKIIELYVCFDEDIYHYTFNNDVDIEYVETLIMTIE